MRSGQTTGTGTGPPRAPGFAHSALALATVLTFAFVLLTAPQSPPPAIAEIAPQAVEKIKEAPEEQASEHGTGGEVPTDGDGGPDENPGEQPQKEVPRVRKCVGSPPRQTEDPQSPPCVPYWDPTQDNGGATWQGVTRDEIRIAEPNFEQTEQVGINLRDFETFLNERYEFYGRKLRFIDSRARGKLTDDPASQRAEAVRADEEHKVFASVHMISGGGAFYERELARRGVISVTDRPNFSSQTLASNRPFMWQYPMPWDRIFATIGEWTCAGLAGGKARHGGEDVRAKTRVFGAILNTEWPDIPLTTQPLKQELGQCGERLAAEFQQESTGTADAWATDAVLRMKVNNVTTVMCLCHPHVLNKVLSAATNQKYYPEWITSTYLLNDHSFYFLSFVNANSVQAGHVFGLTVRPRELPPAGHPALWALKEANANCCDNLSVLSVNFADIEYRSLLLLAAGIQAAGPKLTPETFEQGLRRIVFPNPAHPNRAGTVGFPGSSYWMTQDAAEFWWDPNADNPYPRNPPGALCYVDGGSRRRPGAWPRGPDALFQGPCT